MPHSITKLDTVNVGPRIRGIHACGSQDIFLFMHGVRAVYVWLFLALSIVQSQAAPKLHPQTLLAYANENPQEVIPIIIVPAEPQELRDVFMLLESKPKVLPLISSIAGYIRGREIAKLALDDRIAVIWYEHKEDGWFEQYVQILSALTQAVLDQNIVVNLSMSPSDRSKFDPDEPFNRMTKTIRELGGLVVVSAGNTVERNLPESLSRWCTPWVVCVGAAYNDGKEMWPYSARGFSGSLATPTVVAPGASLFPGDADALNGTSFATAAVSGIVANLFMFLRQRAEESEKTGLANFSFKYDIPINRVPDRRTTSDRVVGKITEDGGVRIGTYPAIPSADVVVQILTDMAVGIKDYGSSDIGAGFVSGDLLDHYLAQYGQSRYTLGRSGNK